MSEPFLGEIRVLSFSGVVPSGWARCDGQQLPINANAALFSLLGVTYGGNGTTTFALPDLRGRRPVHTGNGWSPGRAGGQESHQLTVAELPPHTHQAYGAAAGTQVSPAGAVWADPGRQAWSDTPGTDMAPQAVDPVGGGQAHQNMAPFLALTFVIALQGIFPSQS